MWDAGEWGNLRNLQSPYDLHHNFVLFAGLVDSLVRWQKRENLKRVFLELDLIRRLLGRCWPDSRSAGCKLWLICRVRLMDLWTKCVCLVFLMMVDPWSYWSVEFWGSQWNHLAPFDFFSGFLWPVLAQVRFFKVGPFRWPWASKLFDFKALN